MAWPELLNSRWIAAEIRRRKFGSGNNDIGSLDRPHCIEWRPVRESPIYPAISPYSGVSRSATNLLFRVHDPSYFPYHSPVPGNDKLFFFPCSETHLWQILMVGLFCLKANAVHDA